jgi:hypothetical protein
VAAEEARVLFAGSMVTKESLAWNWREKAPRGWHESQRYI